MAQQQINKKQIRDLSDASAGSLIVIDSNGNAIATTKPTVERIYLTGNASSYLVADGTGGWLLQNGYLRVNGHLYVETALHVRGAINNDTDPQLIIEGGTNGATVFPNKVETGTDLEITLASAGLILKDETEGRWKLTVDRFGALIVTPL